MQPKLIAIAGGTGAGKTTLANSLVEHDPEHFTVVRLDDYYKRREEMEPINGIYNWERPEAISFARLREDLKTLQTGRSITIHTRVWRYNSEYQKVSEENFDYQIDPRPVVLVEGFLVLADPELRKMFDLAVYLDIPIERSLERRMKMDNKYNSPEYFRDVLIPAHKEFVEATKAYAGVVIDVEDKSADQVSNEVRVILEEKLAI